MCLDSGRALKGKSEKWIPAWKEVLLDEEGRVFSSYEEFPMGRRMKDEMLYALPFAQHPTTKTYETGFHAYLEKPKPGADVLFFGGRILRCFIRKATARGKQNGLRVVVGKEMLIPALRMDGTLKSQGRRKK